MPWLMFDESVKAWAYFNDLSVHLSTGIYVVRLIVLPSWLRRSIAIPAQLKLMTTLSSIFSSVAACSALVITLWI